MAEIESSKVPSLAEQYVLPKDAKAVEVPVESAVTEEVVKESDVLPTAVDESAEDTTISADELVETPAVVEEVSEEANVDEDTPAVIEDATGENSVTVEEEKSDDHEEVAEEAPEVKLETAPADFRFPTTNQTRHCFTRYVEYHRCVAAKGDDAPECDKFAKYYRSLCPGEWVDRWNEQRENGTFPGPL